MNTWYFKDLGDAMLAEPQLEKIKLLYSTAVQNDQVENKMAIFFRHVSEGQLHCSVIAYFSPSADSIAKAVHALPCQKPLSKGLGLLIGAENSWTTYFPE